MIHLRSLHLRRCLQRLLCWPAICPHDEQRELIPSWLCATSDRPRSCTNLRNTTSADGETESRGVLIVRGRFIGKMCRIRNANPSDGVMDSLISRMDRRNEFSVPRAAELLGC